MKLPPKIIDNVSTSSLLASSSLPVMTHAKQAATPNIRVLLIDGPTRSIRQIIMQMKPEEVKKVLGMTARDRVIDWAKIGEIDERIHIMLAGDQSAQTVEPGHRWYEQEFEVMTADFRISPILHGKAIVFGFAPKLNKAASTPVNPIWLQERVNWLAPEEARQLRDRSGEAEKTYLESQPRENGETAATGAQDLPALPGN